MRYVRLSKLYGLLEKAAGYRVTEAAASLKNLETEAERVRSVCDSIPVGMRGLLLDSAARVLFGYEEKIKEARHALDMVEREACGIRRMAKGIGVLKDKEVMLQQKNQQKKEGDEVDDIICARFWFDRYAG